MKIQVLWDATVSTDLSTPDVSEKCNALLYVLWDATASTDKYARRFGEM